MRLAKDPPRQVKTGKPVHSASLVVVPAMQE